MNGINKSIIDPDSPKGKNCLKDYMNYLAHAYLSFGNEDILIGNMISDFVKGKQKLAFPESIQKGIHLHRMIDTFTDTHMATKRAKEIFRPFTNRYEGAFVDIVYDHFLAVDEKEFPLNKLEHFASATYHVLHEKQQFLPERFRHMLPYMINQNWLLNYRFEWGIANGFNGIFRRAKYLEQNADVYRCFLDHYAEFQDCYREFFPAVKDFSFNEYNLLQQ